MNRPEEKPQASATITEYELKPPAAIHIGTPQSGQQNSNWTFRNSRWDELHWQFYTPFATPQNVLPDLRIGCENWKAESMGWFQNLLAKMRGTSPPPPQDSDAFEQLVWLEPHENPFGVRVLDCRPVAQTFLSTTRDANCIRFFGSRESQTGEQFRGQNPESAVRVKCDLTYTLTAILPEGPVFLAGAMEEKWNLYHFAGVLYFARSWNGHLYYTASIFQSATELRVVEVAGARDLSDDESLVVRQVDFLIRSHLLGQVAPHPVPPLPTKEMIAMWSFQHYGCRGLFAAVCEGGA